MVGGYHSVNLTLDTQDEISVAGSLDRPTFIAYIIYYFVLALMIIPGLILGRRAACHGVCWMAPFMILRRKLRDTLPGHLYVCRLKHQPAPTAKLAPPTAP